MKKLLLFFICGWTFDMGFAQSTNFSSLREVFNYEVGDSFEYYYRNARLNPFDPYDCTGHIVVNINSALVLGDTLRYGYSVAGDYIDTSFIYNCTYYGGYGYPPFPVWQNQQEVHCAGGTFSVLTPDSLTPSMYGPDACIGNSPTCYDTAFRDGNYNSHRQNHYYDNNFSELDETYVDSLGLANRNLYDESSKVLFHLELVWCRKASGEEWGQYLRLISGVAEVSTGQASILLSPNPASNQLFIETNGIPITQINIYNTAGALVTASQSSVSNQQLSVASLPTGVYLVEIKTTSKPSKGELNTIMRRLVKM